MLNKKITLLNGPLLLLFIILCYGIPLANWAPFIALLIALYATVLKRIETKFLSWIFSSLILLALLITRYSVTLPSIEMGEQIYSSNDKILNNILPKTISKDAQELLKNLNLPFEIYPANQEYTDNPWAFSADSFFINPKMSRILQSLNFKDRYGLRVGKLNDAKYNYFGNMTLDTEKNSTYGKWGAYYPLIFSFLLPQSLQSSEICWIGRIYIKNIDGWKQYYAEEKQCMLLKKEFWVNSQNLQIYAFDFEQNLPLNINLKNNKYTLLYLLSILSSIIILLLLTRLKRNDLLILTSFILSILIFMISQKYMGNYPGGLSGMPYMGRGNDGLTHYSFARYMVEAASNYDFNGWLRGYENVFYMMPGMRYAWGITMPFFGESVFGLLLFVSLVPLAIRKLLNHLTTEKWSKILLLIFLFIPILEAFGFFQLYFIKYTMAGFASGIANTALVIAVAIFWQKEKYKHKTHELIITGFLLAFSIALRPNFAPSIFIMLMGISIYFLYTNKSIIKIFYLGIGFSPFLLIPIHNYYFGKKIVVLTSSATIDNNLRNGPEFWLNCFGGNMDVCYQILDHLSIWIDYNEPWYILVFIFLWLIVLNKKASYTEKLLSISMIAGHFVFFFYDGVARYSHGIWLISLLLSISLVRNSLWPKIFKTYKLLKQSKYSN